MKIKLIFSRTKGNRIPLSYNHLIASFIYRTIEQADSEYSSFLHSSGYINGSKKFKLFTFSQLQIPECKIDPPFLQVMCKNLMLYLSSPVKEWTLHFVSGLFARKKVFLGGHPEHGLEMEVERVETLPEPDFSKTMKVKTLSPITISTGEVKFGKMYNVYLAYEDEQFSLNIKNNLVSKYKALNGYEPKNSDFHFSFDQDYIDKRKGKISKLIDYNGTKIRGYIAPVIMDGEPELMRLAYYSGCGDKNSLGFGCLV